jgi:hypothetical protein
MSLSGWDLERATISSLVKSNEALRVNRKRYLPLSPTVRSRGDVSRRSNCLARRDTSSIFVIRHVSQREFLLTFKGLDLVKAALP